MIYFLQAEAGGPIKVGFTARTGEDRRAEAQPYHPASLRVLAETSGDQSLEHRLKGVLHAWRVRGEWFAPTARVLEALQIAIDGLPLGAWVEACEDAGHGTQPVP